MSIGGKVEAGIIAEHRKDFVAAGVYVWTQVLGWPKGVAAHFRPPDILAAISAFQVGHVIEVAAIWRDGWMSEKDGGIAMDLYFFGFAPGGA